MFLDVLMRGWSDYEFLEMKFFLIVYCLRDPISNILCQHQTATINNLENFRPRDLLAFLPSDIWRVILLALRGLNSKLTTIRWDGISALREVFPSFVFWKIFLIHATIQCRRTSKKISDHGLDSREGCLKASQNMPIGGEWPKMEFGNKISLLKLEETWQTFTEITKPQRK